jgi:hypothetical protein
MAAVVAEVGAAGAEALAPEVEEIGVKLAPKAEALAEKSASAVKTGEAAAEKGGRHLFERLTDVGTGVMIGQSLGEKKEGEKGAAPAAAAAAAAQVVAAAQSPAAAAAAAAAVGGAERGPAAIHVYQRRGLSESLRLGLLLALVIVVVAACVYVAVRAPSALAIFGGGLALGAATGAAAHWAPTSR